MSMDLVCGGNCLCWSEDLLNATKLLTASKKRTFVVVQVSPAVRVSIGEWLGLHRGEDAVGRVVAALTLLGADIVVDTAIVSDALTLIKYKDICARKETGAQLPLFSSECSKWVAYAKENYPEIAETLLPSATSVCAKLLKKYYGAQNPDKKVRVIALEAGAAKKADPGVDVVLTLDELGQMLAVTESNIRLLKKQPMATPFGVGSGAGYIAPASGGDAEALARCLVEDKTHDSLRKFEYSGLYGKNARREAKFNFGGKEWRFAVVDSLAAADELIADVKAGKASYDYVEVTACAGGSISVGCSKDADGEMAKRLRKLGLKYLDFARATRSADGSSAAAVLLKEWNALCRTGEAAAFDVIDEIIDDPDIEEVIEEIVEDVVEDVVEEIVEDIVEEVVEAVASECLTEEAIEEIVEDVVEDIVEDIVEEIVEEVVEEVVETLVEETMENAIEEEIVAAVCEAIVEEAEVQEEPVEETVEEEPVEEEIIEEAPVEEVAEEVVEEISLEEIDEEPVEDVFAEEEETIADIFAEEETEEIVEEVAVAEEPVSEEEIAVEMEHIMEFIALPESELTAAQKAAKAIYYRRLSSTERRKLKRMRRNQKKNG